MSGSNIDNARDDRSMGDPRDHDLVPPVRQPHGNPGPTGEADPDEVDGMLDEGGSREGEGRGDGGRGEALDRP